MRSVLSKLDPAEKRRRDREKSQEYHHRQQLETDVSATQKFEPYTDDEAHYLATTTDTMVVAAHKLGRTFTGVRAKREREKARFDIRTPVGADRAVERMMQTRDPVANPPPTVTSYVGYCDSAYNCYATVIYGDGSEIRFTGKKQPISWGSTSKASALFSGILLRRVLEDNFPRMSILDAMGFSVRHGSDFLQHFVRSQTNGQNFIIEAADLLQWVNHRLHA